MAFVSSLLALSGCSWHVWVESTPVSAELLLPEEERAVTPSEVELRYVPFGHQRMTVSAKGYRTVEVDLRDDEIRLLRYVGTALRGPRRYGEDDEHGARGEIRYLLVPDHGPVGTWTAADVPK